MSQKCKRVLIVDDEPDIQIFLTAWLEDQGYETLTAADGKQGLQIVRQCRPDLILMDLKMPRQSGVQLYRSMQLDVSLRSIPVIFVTGLTDIRLFDDDCAPLPEPFARISKPIDRSVLLTAVERALAAAQSATGDTGACEDDGV